MTNLKCIFCKIVANELPSVRLVENDQYISLLDINPNTKGVTLVIPREHIESDIFDMEDGQYQSLLSIVKKTAKLLEKGLAVKRVAMVVEGMGINHVHIKLYPLHGLEEKFVEMWAKEKKYFEKYEGYLSTQIGEMVSFEKLEEIKEEILKLR